MQEKQENRSIGVEIQKGMEPDNQLRFNVKHGPLVRMVCLVRVVRLLGRVRRWTEDSSKSAQMYWWCDG